MFPFHYGLLSLMSAGLASAEPRITDASYQTERHAAQEGDQGRIDG
jgi:hypothetical protein